MGRLASGGGCGPHWGKVHTLRGERLLERYPTADRFLKVRDELDPDGRFLSPYLAELLGLAAGR